MTVNYIHDKTTEVIMLFKIRLFLTVPMTLFASVALVTVQRPAIATPHTCVQDPVVPIQHCVAGISNFSFMVTAAETQQQSEWCWAASASMILSFLGHPMTQWEIVNLIYPPIPPATTPNFPAGSLLTIETIFTVPAVDDNGVKFTPMYLDVTGNPAQIIGVLDSGNPLYVLNSHHAMVLTGLAYDTDGTSFTMTSARIQDPWPKGYYGFPGGSRVMLQPELSQLQHFLLVTTNP